MMEWFRMRGGVDVDHRKHLSSEAAIVAMPLPARLCLPLQQHIGSPAEPVVEAGARVLKGELLARAGGPLSAPLHASTSGTVVEITELTAPHPSGLPQRTIILEPDGRDEWGPLADPITDLAKSSPKEIAARVAACGVVGLGGATFPTAVKLDLGDKHGLDILVLNGAECEPYLTSDDRLMREYADQIIDGARIIAFALKVTRIIMAIENNKPDALAAMRAAARKVDAAIEVVGIPSRYPMGSERHLVQYVTGREAPARRLTAEVGVVVHNVATARAVYDAVRLGRPLVSRVTTVSGGAVVTPKNVEVPLGVLVSDLIAFCGGLTDPDVRLVSGGPMMGQPLPDAGVPLVKGMSGVLALTRAETREQPTQPCLKCGACVRACPCGLIPADLLANVRKDRLEAAAALGVQDCVGCGSCAYVCPAHIPLVQYFSYAKGRLSTIERERRRHQLVKRLISAKSVRMERLAKAKREAMAARKAALAAAGPAATAPAGTAES